MKSKRTVFVPTALSLASFVAGYSGQGTRMNNADGYISGFQSYHATITPENTHFEMSRAPNSVIHIVSTSRHLDATCAKAEGDIRNKILADATLTGGVHAVIERPTAAKGVSGIQTATADGNKAIYSAENNTLDLVDSVVLHDSDPSAGRDLNATGSSSQVNLSPQGSTGDPFRSVTLQGPVKMDLKGTRLESGKKVPTSMHATSNHATYDAIRRIIVLEGHVHVVSDDPNMPGEETGIEKETITLLPDGSVSDVRAEGAEGSPGVTTLNPETLKGP